jgi:hypothetical protein
MANLSRADTIATGCVIAFGALCLIPVAISWNRPLQPKVPVTAQVVRVYAMPSAATVGYNYHNFRDVVVAATQAGLEGRALVDYTEDRCHVGDLVKGWQQGINVDFDPRTCRRPKEAEADD